MSRFRLPFRKLFRFIVIVYIVLLVGLLCIWGGYLKVPLQNFVLDQGGLRHPFLPKVTVNPKTPTTQQPIKPGVPQNKRTQSRNCPVQHEVKFMGRTMTLTEDPVCGWLKDKIVEGGGAYINYGQVFARLQGVVIDPSLSEGRKGGENISTVINQREEAEYLKLKNGYFNLQCSSPPKAAGKDHLQDWHSALRCKTMTAEHSVKGLTLAVKRYEYVNLYHTMTDYYNAFLMMLIFNQNPDNITVLWVDAHPMGGLDDTWRVLFGKTMRAGQIQKPIHFQDMVWSVMGYNSPLNEHHRPFIPYAEEFREFFLKRYGVSPNKQLNCDKLQVMFIWRRDYVAHPRNPKGTVKRKIANEDELLKVVRDVLPSHNVTGVQLDVLPMRQQLDLIASTDILLGMHGAGLSHTLFLPKHAGLVEFYPIYWPQANRHFRAMAGWRDLPYLTWQNHQSSNERENYFTYIPPETAKQMLLEVKHLICKSNKN